MVSLYLSLVGGVILSQCHRAPGDKYGINMYFLLSLLSTRKLFCPIFLKKEFNTHYLFISILAFCRMIVHGIFFNPPSAHLPRAYFRHSWDRIDFVSIVSYWVDFGLLVTNQEFVEDEGRRILVFKMLSALILLRLLNITDGGKVILNSLKKAAPLLVNVLFFVFFFFVIFA
jgi:hypothetical protein